MPLSEVWGSSGGKRTSFAAFLLVVAGLLYVVGVPTGAAEAFFLAGMVLVLAEIYQRGPFENEISKR
ncbi:MAG: hypothetical protein ACOCT0_02475 [Halobacteriota archaeon]